MRGAALSIPSADSGLVLLFRDDAALLETLAGVPAGTKARLDAFQARRRVEEPQEEARLKVLLPLARVYTGSGEAVLVRPERHHRIHTGGPVGRDVAGEERNGEEEQGRPKKRDRVPSCNAEEQRLQQAGTRESGS